MDPSIEQVLNDPAASDWLKSALRSALERDCIDAATDAAVLANLLSDRASAILTAANTFPSRFVARGAPVG